ncbi:SMP-30/gluconolactonase/LRE family protein [Arthrobacter echini]|uniref:SMP-30/gluconolactonase/LRE family protein n=1 Tax=Arthrobacter echini TaxID=1529066 RepID=A0A5D0XSK7_9MICC|nr:SMP-30/gluconolactonase/LRE family protein [Arthrobacter echini]TYC99545.1 SMP-30/gluconolactonase/LRE family protein [Arthrobacter echini]
MRAQQISDVITFHGEGPYWDPRRGELLLVDMTEGDVLVRHEDGSIDRHDVHPRLAGVVRGRASGGYVIGVERGFVFADHTLTVLEQGPEAFTDSAVRMNDGGCDIAGRFLCGSMGWEGGFGAGALYSLGTDHTISTVLTGVTVSNGLHFSPSGDTAFYSDTPTGRIDALTYDVGSGRFTDRRTFAVVEQALGMPDGMAIDAEGGIWTALYGGGAIARYDAAGRLSEHIPLPTTNVTACAFGGEDLSTLYVTTTQENIPQGSEPSAGALFAVEPGVSGAPLPLFGG